MWYLDLEEANEEEDEKTLILDKIGIFFLNKIIIFDVEMVYTS